MEWTIMPSGLSHLFMTLFLSTFASFMVVPAITDVTMAALCPGQDECSLAIFINGIQQAVTGLGTIVATPLLGNLSDVYGRKVMLTLPLSLCIIPSAILAYDRSKNFIYAYLIAKTIVDIVGLGSLLSISLAYVADTVDVGRRASAFAILSGIISCAFVCGTFSTRFLSIASTFQVSAAMAVIALLYMRLLLPESAAAAARETEKEKLLEKEGEEEEEKVGKRWVSVDDLVALLNGRSVFTHVAVVAFLSHLGEVGLQTSLMFYLKAVFHFNKDQYAYLMAIAGIAGIASQLLLMPLLVPALGEERLLSIGCFFACVHVLLYSIAWVSWVPYLAASFSILVVFSQPCLRSITSKLVGPSEQGKIQGCISGVSSLADVLGPLVFSPLTALFLSEKAPFRFPGFSLMCVGLVSLVAFIQSINIRPPSPIQCCEVDSNSEEVIV
ncbi:hypothetical protein Drorol1_Dr00023715 [Drosera rotundifolia]